MLRWKRDLYGGIGILIFCIANFIYAGFMPKGSVDIPLARPDAYLKMWLALLSILSIVLIIKAIKNKDGMKMPKIWGRLSIFTVVALLIYLLIMPYIGFLISSILFLTATIIVYSFNMGNEVKKGKSLVIQIVKYFAFSVITSVVVAYLFTNLLNVILPQWQLF